MEPTDPVARALGVKMVPFDGPIVEFVDSLILLNKKNGTPNTVTTENDWKTLEYIMQGFETLYPVKAYEFYEHMKKWRELSTAMGVSREGEAIIQHQLEVPEKVMSMIRIVFPNLKWDKKFVAKFSRRFTAFKGSDTKL